MARNQRKSAGNGSKTSENGQKRPVGRPKVDSVLVGTWLLRRELDALDQMRGKTNRPQFLRRLIAERAGLPIDERLSRRS